MRLLFFFFLFFGFSAHSQNTATDSFLIEGEVTKPLTVDWNMLKTYQTVALDSMTIYNHAMVRKGVMKRIKGVLLKDILSKVKLNEKEPKKLSEFYFVCTATDNYKVVYSWNELFNSEEGNHVLVVTEKEGSAAGNQPDRIAIISPTDFATGRRYVKGLKTIVVKRVN